MTNTSPPSITIGVLALQGAFEEHQRAIESINSPVPIITIQIRCPHQLSQIDGIILPGGESTAMGLIGDSTDGLWDALKDFVHGDDPTNTNSNKPTWGTCAGMILLAERCVGTSAVITKGQSLIGGVDILVCRNYFGSQISSFEMNTPPPPKPSSGWWDHSNNDNDGKTNEGGNNAPFPGVFIRAPAILTAGPDVQVLGKVVAAPCRAAAVVLRELENKIAAGENVVQMGVVDALEREAGGGITYSDVRLHNKKEDMTTTSATDVTKADMTTSNECLDLPGASDGSNAREVICAVQKGNILCTAFHPEIADDLRWHEYFVGMVLEAKKQRESYC